MNETTRREDDRTARPVAVMPAPGATGGDDIPGCRPAGKRTDGDLTSALSGGQTHGAGSGTSGCGKTSSPEPEVRCCGSKKDGLYAGSPKNLPGFSLGTMAA